MLHLDRPNEELPGHIVEYKGTYTQYLAARAEDEERLAKIAAQQDAEIDRLQTLADRFGAKATQARRMAHSLDKRVDRIEAARVEAPTHDRTLQRALPAAAAPGRVRARGRRLSPRPTAARRCSRTSTFDARARRAAAGARPQRRGQDEPAADPRRRDRTPIAAPSSSATASRSATTRRSTRASAPAARCSTTCASSAAHRPTSSCAACSACSA